MDLELSESGSDDDGPDRLMGTPRSQMKTFGRLDDDLDEDSFSDTSTGKPMRDDISMGAGAVKNKYALPAAATGSAAEVARRKREEKGASLLVPPTTWGAKADPTEGLDYGGIGSRRGADDGIGAKAKAALELESRKHENNLAGAKRENEKALDAERSAGQRQLQLARAAAAAELKALKAKLEGENQDRLSDVRQKLERDAAKSRSSTEAEAKRKMEHEVEASLKAARGDADSRKAEAKARHELEITELESELAVRKADRKMKLRGESDREIAVVEKANKADLEKRRAAISKRHTADITGLEDEEKKITALRSEHTQLLEELAAKRRMEEDMLRQAIAEKKLTYEAEFEAERASAARAQRAKLDERKRKHQREDDEAVAELKAKSAALRAAVKQEEEAKLKELQGEIQQLYDACDTEKRQIEQDLSKAKAEHLAQTSTMDAEAEEAKRLAAEVKDMKDQLTGGRGELVSLTARTGELGAMIRDREGFLENAVRADAGGPAAEGLAMDDLANPQKLKSGEKRVTMAATVDMRSQFTGDGETGGGNTATPAGGRLEATPEVLDYGSEDSSEDGDLDRNDDYRGYMAKAKEFLEMNRASKRRIPSTIQQTRPSRSTAEVIAEVNQILDDDGIETVAPRGAPRPLVDSWMYDEDDDSIDVDMSRLYHRPPSSRDYGMGSVIAAQERARRTVDRWADDATHASQVLRGHSEWLHGFRHNVGAARARRGSGRPPRAQQQAAGYGKRLYLSQDGRVFSSSQVR